MSKISRTHSPALDEILGQEIRPEELPTVGFVRVIDYMGDQHAITQAARVSYGAGTKTMNDDTGLIRYLMRHRHTTPFEMCEIKLHLKMPVFTARQWVRHRTASINEVSARYSVVLTEFYIPPELKPQSTTNKQGTDDAGKLVGEDGMRGWMDEVCGTAEGFYNSMLDHGVAREQARIILPVGVMTEFYWKVNLHNLLHFLRLRNDRHAQREIRELAGVIWDVIKAWVPTVAEAFSEYQLSALTLPATQADIVCDLIATIPEEVRLAALHRYISPRAADGKFPAREEVATFRSLLALPD